MTLPSRPSSPPDDQSRRWDSARSALPTPSDPPELGRQTGEKPAGPVPVDASLDVILADFTTRWERGERPPVEAYLNRLPAGENGHLVELIYREYCLAGWAGLAPRTGDYLARFPGQAEALGRLFEVHEALGSSRLRNWAGSPTALPEVGDEIGPYRLIRSLGQGGFARVFLAEQTDLDGRLLVVKVTTRVTPEPQLLARASHPHIVEVLWHGLVDDGALQIICMPFLGGATLAEVLAGRRARGTRPVSGRDLLRDLDWASAVGYPVPGEGRPAREAIAAVSYPVAVAWVVARLAEALDHAYTRGVLHGDIKPSNVLLTADGVPMLLDFNLAVGWLPHTTERGARHVSTDAGGTLAYMAPEQLRAVADPSAPPRSTVNDRHRADVYSLGMVLLEMLTGRLPGSPEGGGPQSAQELASSYVLARQGGGGEMIRSARSPLPAGMRAVLARCLATDPADRYGRASELAEDLDRWRTDRPLLFARQPRFSLGLTRWARRQRLTVAALLTGLAVASMFGAIAWRAGGVRREQAAIAHYAEFLRDGNSGAFRDRQPGGAGRVKFKGDPAEIAKRLLDRYGVLDDSRPWRLRPEFRDLPPADRADLEAWLLEQSLRYARTLADRPDAKEDWQRALYCLDRVLDGRPFAPLRAERKRIREKYERLYLTPAPPSPRSAEAVAETPWVGNYLLGVEAELDGKPVLAADAYRAVLKERPGSFWANYRAASVAAALGVKAKAEAEAAAGAVVQTAKTAAALDAARARSKGFQAQAVRHMEVCVSLCPENPMLHIYLAGCLYGQGRIEDADREYEKALIYEPDHAETHLLQSILKMKLGQTEGYRKAIDRYNALTGRHGPVSIKPKGLDLASPDSFAEGLAPLGPAGREAAEPDPDESHVRHTLAEELLKAKQYDLALEEYDRILGHEPENLRARYGRAILRSNFKRDDAARDFALVVEHPQVEALVRVLPISVCAFNYTVISLVKEGKFDQAVQTAARGSALADRFKSRQFESKYLHAYAIAVAAKYDPELRGQALEKLREAYRMNPEVLSNWYQQAEEFKEIRDEFGPNPFGAGGLPSYLDQQPPQTF